MFIEWNNKRFTKSNNQGMLAGHLRNNPHVSPLRHVLAGSATELLQHFPRFGFSFQFRHARLALGNNLILRSASHSLSFIAIMSDTKQTTVCARLQAECLPKPSLEPATPAGSSKRTTFSNTLK